MLGICQVINEKIIPFPTETVLGYGICRLHNLINHSCNPNAAMLTRKRTNVIFAVKPIKEGEQVRYLKFSLYSLLMKLSHYKPILFYNNVFYSIGFHFVWCQVLELPF